MEVIKYKKCGLVVYLLFMFLLIWMKKDFSFNYLCLDDEKFFENYLRYFCNIVVVVSIIELSLFSNVLIEDIV